MKAAGHQYILRRLTQGSLSFAQRLRLVSVAIPQVDNATGVRLVGLLLDSALKDRPTLGELYELCEESGRWEMLHEYLRGFFMHAGNEPGRVEMAERLDEVIAYRLLQNKARRTDRRLKETIAEYLLRARN